MVMFQTWFPAMSHQYQQNSKEYRKQPGKVTTTSGGKGERSNCHKLVRSLKAQQSTIIVKILFINIRK